VKQVVLHLADDLAEIGQVAAQDVELVHAPEFMHDAALALQQPRNVARLAGSARNSA
jgi:hypothetical protein